jgi:hypothetical protein
MQIQLSDKDLLRIVQIAIQDPAAIEDNGDYYEFLRDLAHVVAQHFGGHVSNHAYEEMGDESDDEVLMQFELDDTVPEDGGIYALCKELGEEGFGHEV